MKFLVLLLVLISVLAVLNFIFNAPIGSIKHLSAEPASGSTLMYGRSFRSQVEYNIDKDAGVVWLVTCLSIDGKTVIPESCTSQEINLTVYDEHSGKDITYNQSAIVGTGYMPTKGITQTNYIVHQLKSEFNPDSKPFEQIIIPYIFYYK